MKKILAIVLALFCVTAIFAGCSSNPPASTTPPATASPTAPGTASPTAPVSPSEPLSGAIKTGLGVITTMDRSTDASASAAGLAEIDSTIAVVTGDNSDKILSCIIDAAQTQINFDAAGKLTTPMDTVFKTKDELGDAYGLKAGSGIGKEWNEQAAAFAQYVTGKTLAEVKGIAVSDTGEATGADLTSSVTISIDVFVNAIDKAITSATALGASAGDTLGLGVVTDMEMSKDATADAAGIAQAYSTYTAVTKDASGKVTSCVIDASQGTVNFDTTGKITSDLTVGQPTKDEIGDAYGLKAASGIGKEWYEQAAAFAQYVTGKTASEIAGIAVNDAGEATGADITSSTTIGISGFQAALAKALA